MKLSKQEHLGETQLQQLVSEELGKEESASVLAHLETCSECQSRLEMVASKGNVWNVIRDHFQDTVGVAGKPGLGAEESSLEKLMDILAPTDDPEMLGRIGCYEVCGIVGVGATGIVVKALDKQLNRFVAIKVLSPDVAALGTVRKRFQREAKSIAAVVSQYVVPIYAVSEHQGIPYIVMQYIPGGSLQQRIDREGPLSTCEVVRLGIHTARGLQEAHQQGIVHRDVKPANIMLEGGMERAMVSDFGLARVVNDASLTCSGLLTGTPQYMSPEQARGENVDESTDIYSLGSTLYAACTGHSPFRANNIFGVIKRVCEEQPRAIHEHNPETKGWLVEFIGRLMEKDPHSRINSADEVIEILSAELAHLQSPHRQPAPERRWMRTKSSVSRTRPWFAIPLIVLTVVLGGFAAYGWMSGNFPLAAWKSSAVATDELADAIKPLLTADASKLTKFEKLTEHAFDVQPGGTLMLQADLGDVIITAHDQPVVKVLVSSSIAATDEDAAALIHAKQELNFGFERSDLKAGRDASIVSKWGVAEVDPEGVDEQTLNQFRDANNHLPLSQVLSRNSAGEFKFEIQIPAEFNLEIELMDGDVTTPDCTGNVKVDLEDGKVQLGALVGDLRVQCEDGDVMGSRVSGSSWIGIEDGNVGFTELVGPSQIRIEDGDVSIESVNELSDISVEDGKINVGSAKSGLRAMINGDGDITVNDLYSMIVAVVNDGQIEVTRFHQPTGESLLKASEGRITLGVKNDASLSLTAYAPHGGVKGGLVAEKTKRFEKSFNGGEAICILRNEDGPIHLEPFDYE